MAINTLIITNGYYWKEVSFEEGEMLLAVLQRHVNLPSPCGGKGTCGQCMVEVLGKDGEFHKDIACIRKAKAMTVKCNPLRARESLSTWEHA